MKKYIDFMDWVITGDLSEAELSAIFVAIIMSLAKLSDGSYQKWTRNEESFICEDAGGLALEAIKQKAEEHPNSALAMLLKSIQKEAEATLNKNMTNLSTNIVFN